MDATPSISRATFIFNPTLAIWVSTYMRIVWLSTTVASPLIIREALQPVPARRGAARRPAQVDPLPDP